MQTRLTFATVLALLLSGVCLVQTEAQDTTTLLSKFLVDLRNGSLGAIQPITKVLTGDGTVAAPSYGFANGSSYGFSFNSSAGSIGVSRAGVETARFDGSGLTMRSDWFITWNSGALGAGVATSDVILSRDAANTLALKNGANAQKLALYQTTTGPVANTLDMTAPTISSGFGTSPSIVAGSTAFSMRVNVGTGGAATSGIVAMPTATTGWNCTVQDMTNNIATRQSASTTTTVTFTAASAWTASDILVATCVKY